MGALRRVLKSLWKRRSHEGSDRWGGRVIVEQHGVLEVCDRTIHGIIHDVGLRGVYFAAAELPVVGARGSLRRLDGRAVDVRVVWKQSGPAGGVGLVFDH